MLTVTQQVQSTIEQYQLLCAGDTVFVALSGGADSVALLHSLLSLKDALQLSDVRALHLHHGLRGETADRDERFVRDLCRDLQVPLTVRRVDTAAEAAKHHESLEEAGRRLRYTFFEQSVQGVSNAKIATAHNADDQAETIVMNILRGCGLHGLGGMPITRGNIVRPLLYCAAADIRRFCENQHYPYMTDETNASLCYTRNRVRHTVMPSLQAVNEQAVSHMLQLAAIAKEDHAYLTQQACNLLEQCSLDDGAYDAQLLKTAHPAIQKRALAAAAKQYINVQIERRHIHALTDILQSGGYVNLPQSVRAFCDGSQLVFRAVAADVAQTTPPTAVLPHRPIHFNGRMYCFQVISQKEYRSLLKVHKNLFDFCISYDMINTDLVLRTREAGDTIRPFKRACTKTIKKLLSELKIPAECRDRLPLVCDEKGVLAIVGICVDERAAVRDDTSQILLINITDTEDFDSAAEA